MKNSVSGEPLKPSKYRSLRLRNCVIFVSVKCLHDSLLRDRTVIGVKEPALRKKLLQERQLTLEKAIDIGKSGETTGQRLKDLAAATDPNNNDIHALKQRSEKKPRRDPKVVKKYKICRGTHEL